MAIIKCKMCGGDLAITHGSTIATCEYCGTVQTVPFADSGKKLTLFARANRLRVACEFDKAAGVYEAIVTDFPEEPEAYWGLVLCKYGIEYVDDPATGKKVPTCHRSSFDSVMDDSNYEQTLENADVTARKVYREEAKQIEELRKGIIAVSSKEDPYDIFICYKETDENGDRTLDSVLAQDIYDALTEKRYRVFFSRISLEDKLGQEYEPYIFAALNSSKIMLVIGTDYEYFNAVWVKNEWSRYLKLMTKDKSKHLIPCFKGIDAYDMPKEFARLQAQDLGKVGAIQDLLRGIDKILRKPVATGTSMQTAAQEAVRTIEQEKTHKQVENAVSLGIMALDAGNTNKATQHFEEALKLDSECIGAYLGLIRVIGSGNKVAPYVKKINDMPSSYVLDYIDTHKSIIGNLKNSNNLLTISVKTIRSEKLVQGILDLGIKGDAKDALAYYVEFFENAATVKKMIDAGADVNATIWWRDNYKKWYESYYKVNYESYERELHSVLSTAIDAGKNKQIIELLVNAGADVNYVIKTYSYYHKEGELSDGSLNKKSSVLSWAMAMSSNTEIPEVLILAGADVNYVVQDGKDTSYSLLSYAVFSRKYNLAKLLLEHGADPNVRRTTPRKYKYRYDNIDYITTRDGSDVEEYSPVSDAIWNVKDIAILELLLNHGADPNQNYKRVLVRKDKENKVWLLGYSKYNPLLDAIIHGDPQMVSLLLKKGASPNARYYFEGVKDEDRVIDYKAEMPILGMTIFVKDSSAVIALLEAGASFDDEVVCQMRGSYISNSGGQYKWSEDRFLLKNYTFNDEITETMGSLLRTYGWRGKIFGFLGKTHTCYLAW